MRTKMWIGERGRERVTYSFEFSKVARTAMLVVGVWR